MREGNAGDKGAERQATNYANPLEWLMLHEFISNKVNAQQGCGQCGGCGFKSCPSEQ